LLGNRSVADVPLGVPFLCAIEVMRIQ
jgi:hypothetical protein